MSFVFRLHGQGNNTINGWGGSTQYGSQIIDQINDPNGDSINREITSIPSPFARIDLVKAAFDKVAKSKDLNGNTIHHKMVSDALDVAQIFFEYEKFKDKVEIIVWDKDNCINELLQGNEAHKQFGRVLSTFIQQDGRTYNFNTMSRICLLNYKNGPNEMNIIGATSPATLFFTPANNLKYATEMGVGNDRFFDRALLPLHRRDKEFIKSLYALRRSVNNFAALFPEVENYMVECLNAMDNNTRLMVNSVTGNDYSNDYNQIAINDNAGNTVSILDGIEFRCKRQNLSAIGNVSDFVIDSPYRINNLRPLVLPVSTYAHPAKYTQDSWNKDTKVPYYDERPISDRILPDDGTKYPYLTIGDFLTDSIVKMPYEIDNDYFFDGSIKKSEGNAVGYLLPLTDLFFEFFTVKDLREREINGKPMFEFEPNVSGVTVILRIPIRKGKSIEYRRTYFDKIAPSAGGARSNDGTMVENKFGLGIMPFMRFPENVEKDYRVAMFDKCKSGNVLLTFKDGNRTINSKQVICCPKDPNRAICSHESYIVEDNFDRIKVEIGGSTGGYVIPMFKNTSGSSQYTFAVDYGTTNTHIEFCTDANKNPQAFVIEDCECQIRKMHKKNIDPDIRMGFVQDFIPDTIGGNEYKFPMRTVYAHIKNIDFNRNPVALADGHIPFLYEKDFIPRWNDIKTEMKWGGVHDTLLQMHIETLFILLRNKVVLNNGDLSKTKIVWFYPASMNEAMVLRFKRFWQDAYNKYFGNNNDNIISLSESIAPYCNFITNKGATNETVTIDVGGGTTDVLMVENAKPKMLMSFRYASNTIFGDSFNSNLSSNGFINTYLNTFEDLLKTNNLLELLQALKQIEAQNKSSDIIAFLFSLRGEKVKNNPALDFSRKLETNDKLRYVFILFYGSIFYFIAKSMKAKSLMKPTSIAFSGNGSHTLHIVSTDNDMIARFVKLIFDKVYGNTDGQIKVIMEDNPKTATCKGGIKWFISPECKDLKNYDNIEKIKKVFVGNSFEGEIGNKIRYADITDNLIEDICNTVSNYFKFIFELHRDNNDFITTRLGADNAIFNEVSGFCLGSRGKQIIKESLRTGVRKKLYEVNENKDAQLEDTLFFYPLVGLIHDLAFEISKM